MRVAGIFFNPTPPDLAPFAESCLRFSPQICLKRPGTVFIEIGKCKTLYSETTFLARLQILLNRFNLKATTVLGASVLETIFLYRYKSLALSKLPIECFYDVLDPFQTDLDSLKIAGRMIDNLEQVGIYNVEQFCNLPFRDLLIRFGAAARLIQMRLSGDCDFGWPLWTPTEKVQERIELFDSDYCLDMESLLFHLKSPLERLFTRLWGRGLRASSLRIQLHLDKFSTVKYPTREWKIEFIIPQSTARGTLPILRERLNRDLSRKPLESAVLSIDLEVLQWIKDYKSQRHFFNSKEDIEENFNSALSQLAEGLGKNNVFRATIYEEAIAEKSWSRDSTEQNQLPDLSDYIPPRPTKLLRSPELVEISQDTILIRTRPYRILKWSAVEQIATHWIDQEIIRSYYCLDLEGKSPVWVFKSPQNEYYLHGYFG